MEFAIPAINELPIQPGILEIMLWLAGAVLSLVALICAIIVVVKMFQHDQAALGILTLVLMLCSIGQLMALIVGWMKVSEWQIRGIMLTFTATFLLGPMLFIGGYGIFAVKLFNRPEVQQQFDEIDLPEIVIE